MKEFIKSYPIASVIMIPTLLWTTIFGIIFLILSITGNVFIYTNTVKMIIVIVSSLLGVLIGNYIRKVKDEGKDIEK